MHRSFANVCAPHLYYHPGVGPPALVDELFATVERYTRFLIGTPFAAFDDAQKRDFVQARTNWERNKTKRERERLSEKENKTNQTKEMMQSTYP